MGGSRNEDLVTFVLEFRFILLLFVVKVPDSD